MASRMSTAGAVPVRNSKGELRMEKVKVKRYVAGKTPDFATATNDDVSSMLFHPPHSLPTDIERRGRAGESFCEAS